MTKTTITPFDGTGLSDRQIERRLRATIGEPCPGTIHVDMAYVDDSCAGVLRRDGGSEYKRMRFRPFGRKWSRVF